MCMKMMKMVNKNVCVLCMLTSLILVGCMSTRQDIAKEQALKKAKAMGLNLAKLKEGEACKYIGFIGDNSLFANDITLVVGDHQCGHRQCDNHSHYAEQATPD